jgi:hypothetical protein
MASPCQGTCRALILVLGLEGRKQRGKRQVAQAGPEGPGPGDSPSPPPGDWETHGGLSTELPVSATAS